MDETAKWLGRLASWVGRTELLPIDYVGLGYERIINPPVPLVELCFAVTGRYADLKVGDRTLDLNEGELSMHSVAFGNYCTGSPGARCWCVFFDTSATPEFAPFLQEPLACKLTVGDPQRIVKAYQLLSVRCRMPPVSQKPYSRGAGDRQTIFRSWLVKAAVLELIGSLLVETGDDGEASPSSEPPPVRVACEHMTASYEQHDLDLRQIARRAGLSPSHFSRVFRASTGYTPMQYLKEVRLRQGRYLLERTDLRVGEVAWSVGYKDPLHFSRVFREHFGTSPMQYRQSLPPDP